MFLFVYGTLKRGERNFSLYCKGARNIQNAALPGKLYHLLAGYPALVVPEEIVLGQGSADLHADLDLQRAVQAKLASGALSFPTEQRRPGSWPEAFGELMEFAEGPEALAAIDRLEGFQAGKPGIYDRVLAPVRVQGGGSFIAAWTYVMLDPGPHVKRMKSGRWPAG